MDFVFVFEYNINDEQTKIPDPNWEDFEENGVTTELDKIDKIQTNLRHQQQQQQQSGWQILDPTMPLPPKSGRKIFFDTLDKEDEEDYFDDDLDEIDSDDFEPQSQTNSNTDRSRNYSVNSGSGRPDDVKLPHKTKTLECNFCKKNKETRCVYESHNLRSASGIVTCPVLRSYVCPLCQQTGDYAHTVSYCVKNRLGKRSSSVYSSRLNSTGIRRF